MDLKGVKHLLSRIALFVGVIKERKSNKIELKKMETRLKTIKNWNELKTELKQKHPNLTDADLAYSVGKENELVEKLKMKLNKTTTEIIYLIERLQFAKSQTVNSKHYNLLFETNLYDKVYVKNKINFRLN